MLGAVAHRRLGCLGCLRSGAARLSSSSKQERQGFGSFHSDDIEELVRQPMIDPPAAVVAIEQQVLASLEQIQRAGEGPFFGARARQLWALDPEWTFLNHGAFGATPHPLLLSAQLWRLHCERQPLRFFDRELLPAVAYSLQRTAAFLHCSAQELFPLPNVTSGLNAVLGSVRLQRGEEAVCLSLGYGANKKMLADLCNRAGAHLRTVQLPLPLESEQQILAALCETLQASASSVSASGSGGVRLVLLDAITSNSALQLPVLQMAALARQLAPNALVVIDAAHSLLAQDVRIYPEQPTGGCDGEQEGEQGGEQGGGQRGGQAVPLSVSSVAHVWLTNGHKWLCAPKGCAFMWAHPDVAPHLRPAIVSHGFHPHPPTAPSSAPGIRWWHEQPAGSDSSGGGSGGRLLSGLAWDGCRDYAALLSAPMALRMWQDWPADGAPGAIGDVVGDGGVGEGVGACRNYMRELLHQQAVPLLAEHWGLKGGATWDPAADVAPRHMREGVPMALVPLPEFVAGRRTRSTAGAGTVTDADAFQLQEALFHDHALEVPVKCLEGRLYVRLSAHVYNTLDQYAKLAQTIRDL
ncbi:pyridoxal phosphate-dependent transferase [Ochromonadaceae sp. CCMP2298]|nr:pyridoxal phosphate-dependent transferase [Ochromonadaceae sp. CCMP2298]